MPNLWTYEQKFNDLNTAALNGQDSWSTAEGTLNVVTTSPYEGAKCVEGSGERADRTLPSAIANGTFYISIKPGAITGSGAFLLLNDSGLADISVYLFDSGNIKVYDGNSASWVTVGTYSAGTWIRIGIVFECGAGGWEGLSAGYFKVSIDNGAWSSAIKMERSSRNTINTLRLYRYGGDTHYYDYISPNYSEPVSFIPKIMMI